MVRRQRCGASETMFLGAAYGALWWCIGPLTLQPLALGHAPAWDVAAAQREFPSLVGHLLFGVGTALVSCSCTAPARPGQRPSRSGPGPSAAGWPPGRWPPWPSCVLPPPRAGCGRRRRPRAAPGGHVARSDKWHRGAWVRGQGTGFVAWVVGELTVLPLLPTRGCAGRRSRTRRASRPARLAAAGERWPRWPHLLDRLAPVLSSEHLRRYHGPTAGSGVLARRSRGPLAGTDGAPSSASYDAGAVAEVPSGSPAPTAACRDRRVKWPSGRHRVSKGCCSAASGQDVTCALGWGLCEGFPWWVLGAPHTAAGLLGEATRVVSGRGRRPMSALAGPPGLRRLPRVAFTPGGPFASPGWPAPASRPSGPCAAARSSWPPPRPCRPCCWPCS